MESLTPRRVVLDVEDGHGRILARERIEVPAEGRRITVGRGIEADVIVDDPHVAAMHLAIDVGADGRITATDLGSRNGVFIDGRRMRGVEAHPLGAEGLKLGRLRLRVRTGAEVLAPERPDREIDLGVMRNIAWLALACGIAWTGVIAYNAWVGAPRDLPTAVGTSLIFAFAAATVWVGIWSLLSRILQGEWRWLIHAVVLFGTSAVMFVADLVLDLGWFAFDLPLEGLREAAVIVAGLAILLYLHLTNASALRRRTALIVSVLLPVLGVGATAWIQARNEARNVNHIAVKEKIYPPVWKLRGGSSIESYFADAQRLRIEADQRSKAMPSLEAADEAVE